MSATHLAIKRPPASMLWFLYVGAGLGCPDIGRIFERDAKTVLWWLRRAGIQTRRRGSNERVWLKPGHQMNLGTKRSPEVVRAIREATMRRRQDERARGAAQRAKDGDVSGTKMNLCVAHLATEEGATEAGVQVAVHVAKEILQPVWDHMPPNMRPVFFERLESGMVGAACSEFGPDRTKQALDAVKLAIDDVQAERRRTH